MTLDNYIKIAGQSILQATYIYDLARSAEKITMHHSSQRDEDASPYLICEMGINKDPHGYILRPSIEMNAAINIYHTGDVTKSPKNEEGSIKLDWSLLPELDGSRVTPYIAKTSIIEQFELLKNYLITLNVPHSIPAVKKATGKFNQDLLDVLEPHISRRNELTHELFAKQPNMKEAVEYSYRSIWLAKQFKYEQAHLSA